VIYDESNLPRAGFPRDGRDQARRRLGLTGTTLVREDGRETRSSRSSAPKYDVPWKILERQGWIATAHCVEVRLALKPELSFGYLAAGSRERFRIASENPDKLPVVQRLVSRHADDRVLIIGQYLDQLDVLVADLKCPLISGRTPTREREELYSRFRGAIKLLAVSKVGLRGGPAGRQRGHQVPGTSAAGGRPSARRILRPKSSGRRLHSLVTRDSRRALAATYRHVPPEQGYTYEIRASAVL
jgi:DNA excision repair protein ERCC-3